MIIWKTSVDFRRLIGYFLTGNFVLLTPGMYESSVVIQKFGRWAVAAEAPYTLLDNSLRFKGHGVIYDFFVDHFDFLGYYFMKILVFIFVFSFLVPGLVIFFNALVKNLKPFLSGKRSDWSERKSQMGSLFIIFHMFFIPFIAFTPWFIWYIMPLLLVYVFFANASLNSAKVSKYLYLTIFVTNSLTY